MWLWLTTFIHGNPFVAGGIGMALAGWAAAHLKELPFHLWSRLKDAFSITLTIYSEDHIFVAVNRWLSLHPSTKRMRRLTVARWYEVRHGPGGSVGDSTLAPGPGFHVMWHRGRPFFVNRHVQGDKDGAGPEYIRRQTLEITTLGRSQSPIREFLKEIERVENRHDTIAISVWDGIQYCLTERRAKRSLATVDCAPGLKEGILKGLQKFYDSASAYHAQGVPYRRGYLLTGEPGVGKTSLIFALASAVEKPIFLLNPSALDNDNQLQHAVNAVQDGFLVIEDIDSLRASENRATADHPDVVGDAAKSGVTLSGLLNAFDGIGTKEGNVLFLTSNKPEVLDPALIRPGRIDEEIIMLAATEVEARAMFRRLKPGGDVEGFIRTVKFPCAQASIQNMILKAAEHPA